MSDLISREEALKALKETYPTVWTESDYELGQKNQWSSDEIAILTVPSAERKERWLFNRQYHEADECVCSGCGQLMTTIHGERWTPVSERLPEEYEIVNITWVNRRPVGYYEHIKDVPFVATGVFAEGDWYWYSARVIDILREYGDSKFDSISDNIDVIAWQPLPECYRGDE